MNSLRLSLVASQTAAFVITSLAFAGTTYADAPNQREPDEIGPNSRTWKTTRQDVPGNSGKSQESRVVEIATGMNYWDGTKYAPSNPSFKLVGKSFVADEIQHPVSLSANINQIGAVNLKTPDGIVLKSTPVGIGLYDARSGQSVVIGTIKDTAGVLVGNNQIVFENAFAGVCANVVYTLGKGTFEQDIVFTGRINPVDYGFPLETSRIQIFTEFYDTPKPDKLRNPLYVEKDPAIRNRMVSPDRMDETVGFGSFVIGVGKMFLPASKDHPNGSSTLVAKEYKVAAGRNFLIESVPCNSLQKHLDTLPKCEVKEASLRKTKGIPVAQLPKPHGKNNDVTPRRATPEMAYLVDRSRSVVIDYSANIAGWLNGTTVFSSNYTYIVTGVVICNGAAVIEGGVVFKYKIGTYIILGSSLTLKTSENFPAIFTALDDDSVGESASGTSGYTGSIDAGGYANPALLLYYSFELNNLQVSYAQQALSYYSLDGYGWWNIHHSRFLNCIRGIHLGVDGCALPGSGPAVYLDNCLFSGVQTVVSDNAFGYTGAAFVQCTVANATELVNHVENGYGITIEAYNSVFSKTTNISFSTEYYLYADYNGFYYSFGNSTFGSHDVTAYGYPFQSLGSDNHYLDPASGFVDMGNQTADALGLYHFTTSTNQMKETNTTVDLGYHYVASDGAGHPLDTDGDGLADYLEDSNGNGAYNVGTDLSNWQSFSTDGSGLSDGWEISYFGHTGIDPNADPDGDGLTNGQEYSLGIDPTLIDSAQSGSRLNYIYDPGGWLQQITGARTGSVTSDSEGNVQQVNQ